MRLLIYEYASGGGFTGKAIPPSILSEGFGMLRSLVSDAKSAGIAVTASLDKRLLALSPLLEADKILVAQFPGEAEQGVQESAKDFDAAYVVAPESHGVLKKIVEKTESQTVLLNCSAEAIDQVSDKKFLQQHAKEIGLSVPSTLSFTVKDPPESIRQVVKEKIGFPAIFKPADSVGGEGISIAKNDRQVTAAITKTTKRASSHFLVQELVQGTAASVTLISNGTEALPVTLNKQNITLGAPSQNSSYNGGTTPLDNAHRNEAFKTAKRLVESVKGLRGYVGVDVVLTENEPVVIEVNPRLTTSYIGIRKILGTNIAEAIMDSTLGHKLPRSRVPKGYAHFEKIKISNPTYASLRETFNMPELIAPPFPTAAETCTYAMICTQGSTALQAESALNNAKTRLRNILQKEARHTAKRSRL